MKNFILCIVMTIAFLIGITEAKAERLVRNESSYDLFIMKVDSTNVYRVPSWHQTPLIDEDMEEFPCLVAVGVPGSLFPGGYYDPPNYGPWHVMYTGAPEDIVVYKANCKSVDGFVQRITSIFPFQDQPIFPIVPQPNNPLGSWGSILTYPGCQPIQVIRCGPVGDPIEI